MTSTTDPYTIDPYQFEAVIRQILPAPWTPVAQGFGNSHYMTFDRFTVTLDGTEVCFMFSNIPLTSPDAHHFIPPYKVDCATAGTREDLTRILAEAVNIFTRAVAATHDDFDEGYRALNKAHGRGQVFLKET